MTSCGVTRESKPSSPSTTMSRFRDGLVSRKGFAPLPKIGDDVPGLVQPRGSLDGSTSSCDSGISSRYIPLLEEGDLITGTVSITHDRICMLPAIRDGGHVAEERALVCPIPPLLVAQFNPSEFPIRRNTSLACK